MRPLLLSLLSVQAAATLTAAQPSPPCLRYEPDTVAIGGRLRRLTFPGRPNYERVADGDETETGYYLELPAPICAAGGGDSDLDTLRRGVRRVQLVLDSAGYARLRPRLGRRVVLRGTLFASHTGHHHAPLLLQVLWLPERSRPDARGPGPTNRRS